MVDSGKVRPFMSNQEGGSSSSSSSLLHYVLPLYKVYYAMFLFPHAIVVDGDGRCSLKNGGKLRQAICLLLDVLMLWYFVASLYRVQTSSITAAMSVLYFLMYTIFISYALAVMHFSWAQNERVVLLLNEISQLCAYLGNGYDTPVKCRRREKFFVIYLSILFNLLLTIAFALVALNLNMLWEALSSSVNAPESLFSNLYDKLLKPSSSAAVNLYTFYLFSENNLDQFPPLLVIFIGVWKQILDVLTSAIWILTFCLLLLWSLLWARLFQAFLFKVKMGKYLGTKNLSQDIHDFSHLSALLYKWNGLHGNLTFFAILSSIFFASVTAGETILDNRKVGMETKVVNLVVSIPLILLLFSASRVHHLAWKFPSLIKSQVILSPQTTNSRANDWANKVQLDLTTSGPPPAASPPLPISLPIIFNELQSNEVGIQGAGFFTITYSFIGTAVSVVATYAVVMMQWSAVN